MHEQLITQQGYDQLCQELEHYEQTERPNISEAIRRAREHGDLSENAEYQTAKDKQGMIEANIRYLTAMKQSAKIINSDSVVQDGKVRFGSYVSVLHENSQQTLELRLTGEYEAKANEDQLSYKAPLGQSLLGKEQGEIVMVGSGADEQIYEILKISYTGHGT